MIKVTLCGKDHLALLEKGDECVTLDLEREARDQTTNLGKLLRKHPGTITKVTRAQRP